MHLCIDFMEFLQKDRKKQVLKKNITLCLKRQYCRIFLLLGFYVKSILADSRRSKTSVLTFLEAFNRQALTRYIYSQQNIQMLLIFSWPTAKKLFSRFLVIGQRARIPVFALTTQARMEIPARVVYHAGKNGNFRPGGQKFLPGW